MRPIQIDSSERRCSCGASLENGMKRCRKCRARSRYRRRKRYASRDRRRPRATRGR
jgi:hypothetical protein